MTRAVDAEAQTYVVHFTSVPPEVDAYFQAHLRYAGKALAGSPRTGTEEADRSNRGAVGNA